MECSASSVSRDMSLKFPVALSSWIAATKVNEDQKDRERSGEHRTRRALLKSRGRSPRGVW